MGVCGRVARKKRPRSRGGAFANARRAGVGDQNPETDLRGSVSGCIRVAGSGVGCCGVTPPLPTSSMGGGDKGVGWYHCMGVTLLTFGL
jgi:hypothetical protein